MSPPSGKRPTILSPSASWEGSLSFPFPWRHVAFPGREAEYEQRGADMRQAVAELREALARVRQTGGEG